MILIALILLPLAAAALCFLRLSPRFASAAALAAALAVLGLSAWVSLRVGTGAEYAAASRFLSVDALSAMIILVVSFVYATAVLFSIGYMRSMTVVAARRFYCNLGLFAFSLLLVPLVREPNVVWISVEFTTLFSVFLVSFDGTVRALEAAWKYVAITLMGAAIALFGFLVLYWAARSVGISMYSWSGLLAVAPMMSPILTQAAFALILVGLGAKVGLVPLHTWLPDAHSQAPAPVCALLSGVETSVVLYVILRLLPILRLTPGSHADEWAVAFGLLSVGAAAFLLVRVRDYKRLFAFSTIEQMGVILVAAGLGGVSAHVGAGLQLIAHAVTKSFCFYAAGATLLVTGTQEIVAVRGLFRRSPLAGAALFLGGLAIAGAPPFALFLSEFSILRSGLSLGSYAVVGLLVAFIVVSFFAIMNHVSRMVFGEADTGLPRTPGRIPATCVTALAVAATPVVVLGVYIPQWLHRLILLAAGWGG